MINRTSNEEAIELAEKLVDAKIEAEDLLQDQKRLINDYDELIKRCDNILNS